MFRNSIILILILIGFLGQSCRQENLETKIEIPLNSAWKFRKADSKIWYPAHVPGSLSADIALIYSKEGFPPLNVESNTKTDWEYLTSFDLDNNALAHDVVQLWFKGIISNAEIYLNDSLLLKTSRGFSPKSVSCKRLLKKKNNQLRILFRQGNGRNGRNQGHFSKTDSFTKNQSSGKEMKISPSIGIWRPVYLEAWSVARIDDVSFVPDSISAKRAIYSAKLSLTSVVNLGASLELSINNKPFGKPIPIFLKKGNNVFSTKIIIDKPKLWWTNGLGNPNLYNITVRLIEGQSVIQEKVQRLGVRTIEVVNRLDSTDRYVKLNGMPVFLKGAGFNLHNFLPNGTAMAIFNKTVDDAKESNFNILRVPNMEIYDDSFYDLCDSNGILLWQDIQTTPFWNHNTAPDQESIKQEMVETLNNIRKHPCLALFWIRRPVVHTCEDKTDSSISDKSPTKTDQNTSMFFLQNLVKEHGASTPYLSETDHYNNRSIAGIDLFNGKLAGNVVINYGLPITEIKKTDNEIRKECNSLKDFMQKNFRLSKDPESEVYLTRLAQSEIIKSVIEKHRISMPRCMGSVYEQINADRNSLWLSTIDSSGKWTPSQYAIKDAFSHILVAPVREKNEVNIYAVSDSHKNSDATLLVRLIDFRGKDIFVRQIPVVIEANTSSILMSLKEKDFLNNTDRTQCCLVIQLNQATKTSSQNILYFTEFKNLKLPKPQIDMDINDVVRGYNIILKSPVLVKNIFIQTLTKECSFSDNNFDLLPGKRKKIHVSYNGTRDELLKDIRIRSFADIK